jgi:hypothetical protein
MTQNKVAPTADAELAGAPEEEIEVTPEMIEAGIRRLCTFDIRFGDDEDLVVVIYEAMETIRRRTLESS